MDRLISEKSVMEVIYGCDWFIDEEHAEVIKERIKAIPPAEPRGDLISRQALLDDFGFSEKTRKWGGDHSGYNTMMLYEIQDMIESAPPVKPQEVSITWVTGADGAKIAFWDVPVWKVTKICEILVEPQESENT